MSGDIIVAPERISSLSGKHVSIADPHDPTVTESKIPRLMQQVELGLVLHVSGPRSGEA